MRGTRAHGRRFRKARSGSARAVGRVFDALLAGSATLIVAFHGWLFWTHLTSGRILDPHTAVRWVAAGTLLIALYFLRRLGVSLLWSRHAAVVWLMVALLHVGIAAPAPVAAAQRGTDAAPVFVIPSAAIAVLACAACGWLLSRRRRTGERQFAPPIALWLVKMPATPALLPGTVLCYAPRPPPL